MSKITYDDKVDVVNLPQYEDNQKVKAADLNEIKTVVNANYDEAQGDYENLNGTINSVMSTSEINKSNIGDLLNLTTTTKSNLVDAINEVSQSITDGVVTSNNLVLLWSNSDASSNFSSQTITLSSDDYDYLIWIFDYYRSGNFVVSFISIKGQGLYPNYAGDYGVSGTYYVSSYLRTVTYNSATSFAMSDCYCRYGNNTGRYTENNRLIPIAIYGGKF